MLYVRLCMTYAYVAHDVCAYVRISQNQDHISSLQRNVWTSFQVWTARPYQLAPSNVLLLWTSPTISISIANETHVQTVPTHRCIRTTSPSVLLRVPVVLTLTQTVFSRSARRPLHQFWTGSMNRRSSLFTRPYQNISLLDPNMVLT